MMLLFRLCLLHLMMMLGVTIAQLFVCFTYTSAHNRRVNHTMVVVHTYISLSFVCPIALAAKTLAQHIVSVSLFSSSSSSSSLAPRPLHVWLSILILLLYGVALIAVSVSYWSSTALCNAMLSKPPPVDIGFSIVKAGVALVLHNALVPIAALKTALDDR